MTDRQAYSYTVLRYVHDVITGECVNVGVLLFCKDSGFLRAKIRTTYGRLAAAFPDLNGPALRKILKELVRAIDHLAKENTRAGLLRSAGDVAAFARTVLPDDDSSLRWSQIGSGVTHDPEGTLDRLFDRMVARYDEKAEPRKHDEEIWRPVRDLIKERNLELEFERKTIRSDVDEIEFKRAWKNGVWHCYEPLSFDLLHSDGIKDKAHRWAGRLLGVQDTPEKFKPYFIVGRPQNPDLDHAFQNAVKVLKMSPHRPEIFLEEDAEKLVDQIEGEVRRSSKSFRKERGL